MKISVITCMYNSESTLRDTMESVLSQSYRHVEYILVDGASTDGTIDLIREYEPKIRESGMELKFVSEQDKGIYDAMNKGIAMATGEVVGILNSDDFFTSSTVLERVAVCMANQEIDALYGDIHFVDPSDLARTVRYYSSKIFKPWLFRFGFMPAHPSFYVRKRFYNELGGYSLDYKIASDYDLLIRFLYTNRLRTRYMPMDFVTMRTGGVSTEGLHSRILLNREIVRACRKYGIVTFLPLLFLKYLYKVFE